MWSKSLEVFDPYAALMESKLKSKESNMSRTINHIRRWNAWRKNSLNSWWHKLLVLLKLRRSPTMEFCVPNYDMPDSAILVAARGNGKSGYALELYRKKLGIPDDKWEEMKREVERRLYDQN